jgi:hypothetical protein
MEIFEMTNHETDDKSLLFGSDGQQNIADNSAAPETVDQETDTSTVRNDWPRKLSADVAHRREGHMFPVLSYQTCQRVRNLEHPFMSNQLPLEDLLFSLLQKTYFIFSSRRIDSWTQDAKVKGQITESPAPNTLLWYLRRPELTPVLQYLIGVTSLPFVNYDRGFAVDSTHIYTEVPLVEWGPPKKAPFEDYKWVRQHMICGVSSQIVTASYATPWPDSEKKYFEPLLRRTVALGFDVKAVMGDKNYISKKNLELVHEIGATPFITFKKNNVKSKKGANPQWDEALESFRAREGEDLEPYRERNMIETVNFTMKRKFGNYVRGINETAQFNESLCKAICYNLCRLNRYDLNLNDRPSNEEWEAYIERMNNKFKK